MARCPLARWSPVAYDGGAYAGGPFRIVHHTTEGGTVASNVVGFAHSSAPHFVVGPAEIVQLIDTGRAAAALRHRGPPETNRWSAVQMEVVGFAGKPKDSRTLENVRRLCRWIEAEHKVPKVWPNGPPIPAVNGKDPGRHNRDADTWLRSGGHYGHEHVPGNVHWDPAYTTEEVELVMADAPKKSKRRSSPKTAGKAATKRARMTREKVPAPVEVSEVLVSRQDAVDNVPTLRQGDSGTFVRVLQRYLGIKVDGDFGPTTDAAVRVFQKENGLVVDGVVGRRTWEVLLSPPVQDPPLPVVVPDDPPTDLDSGEHVSKWWYVAIPAVVALVAIILAWLALYFK
jgi:hypothetical protein